MKYEYIRGHFNCVFRLNYERGHTLHPVSNVSCSSTVSLFDGIAQYFNIHLSFIPQFVRKVETRKF